MSKYRLIEAFIKVLLWMAAIMILILSLTKSLESLPEGLQTFITALGYSLPVILLWFMPSSIAERKLKKGLKYLDRDNDRAACYFKEYFNSKILSENERINALRILGVAHHKRGDDKEAIHCLNQALEGHEKDNDLKVEILGAMGMIYSESGEYQKAIEQFDKTFAIIFSMSKAHIDKAALMLVVNTYIKAGQRDRVVQIYDRLLMIRGFKRDKRVEVLLGLAEEG